MPDKFSIPNPMTRGERVERHGDTEIRYGTVEVNNGPVPADVKQDGVQYVRAELRPDGSLGRSEAIAPDDPLIDGARSGATPAEEAAIREAREEGERHRRQRTRRRLGLDDA